MERALTLYKVWTCAVSKCLSLLQHRLIWSTRVLTRPDEKIVALHLSSKHLFQGLLVMTVAMLQGNCEAKHFPQAINPKGSEQSYRKPALGELTTGILSELFLRLAWRMLAVKTAICEGLFPVTVSSVAAQPRPSAGLPGSFFLQIISPCWEMPSLQSSVTFRTDPLLPKCLCEGLHKPLQGLHNECSRGQDQVQDTATCKHCACCTSPSAAIWLPDLMYLGRCLRRASIDSLWKSSLKYSDLEIFRCCGLRVLCLGLTAS